MNDVTLAILAGGEGSRMGQPKGDLRIDDEPILAYLLREIAWDGPSLLVTAPGREHPPGWERFDREAVDPVAAQGPLRGVLTALEHATTPAIVVTTVDMPGVRAAQLRSVVGELARRPDALGIMTRRGAQVEPFPSAFRLDARGVVKAELEGNRRSVRRLCDRAEFTSVPAPREWNESVWTNLNRTSDLEAFLSRDRKG